MAKKFKDYYDAACATLLADKIASIWPQFNTAKFLTNLVSELPDKEFLARQDAFVDAFERVLPSDLKQTTAIFNRILGPELDTTAGMFTYGWWLWPVGRYVERHGTQDFQTSMAFIYELTKRFTGEFAIRPLIARYPKPALKMILQWSTDQNVHVRRLASECLRIRLPWAKKSLVAIQEFDLYKSVLGNLKNAPEKFVQKSVGNNLNDLMKEAPAKAREIIADWQDRNPGKATQWIIWHGLRSERKKSGKTTGTHPTRKRC